MMLDWKEAARYYRHKWMVSRLVVQQGNERLDGCIAAIMDDVVNLEWMNCTHDPDMCHATREELVNIMRRRILGED